jgi:hypothetical protein
MKMNDRSPVRERQKVWFSTVTEKLVGMATVNIYSNPVMKRFTVSAGAGTPTQISAGIVPDYDREITSYDRTFKPTEGDAIWVDAAPELNDDGSLVVDEQYRPSVPPDYRLTKIFDTQKGNVAVYGIRKVGGNNVTQSIEG